MSACNFNNRENKNYGTVKYSDSMIVKVVENLFSRKTATSWKSKLKLISLLMIGMSVMCCASSNSVVTNTDKKPGVIVISEMTTSQTALLKSDVAKYFCYNLTEYFNTYKYYRISSEVYSEKEKQNYNATAKITKSGSIYNVEYIGSAGQYVVSFSNATFHKSEQIFTFGSFTVLGNAIRSKVYDTFLAWVFKEEIALKANYNSHLYSGELNAAVEIEKWYNSLSATNHE